MEVIDVSIICLWGSECDDLIQTNIQTGPCKVWKHIANSMVNIHVTIQFVPYNLLLSQMHAQDNCSVIFMYWLTRHLITPLVYPGVRVSHTFIFVFCFQGGGVTRLITVRYLRFSCVLYLERMMLFQQRLQKLQQICMQVLKNQVIHIIKSKSLAYIINFVYMYTCIGCTAQSDLNFIIPIHLLDKYV